MDIPTAASTAATQTPPVDSYDFQKAECLKAIAKIGQASASASVFFRSMPEERLIKEIEEKGYQVTYTLNYDGKKEDKFACRVRIVNPSIPDPATTFITTFEEGMKNAGFNQTSINTEDSFIKIFNNLMKL